MDRASQAPVIDIGIDEADRVAIAEGLWRSRTPQLAHRLD